MPQNLIRTVIVAWVIFYQALPAFSGITEAPAGGRSSALGSSSVALNDFWSVHLNPAGLADYNHLSFGAGFENRFLLSELNHRAIALILPVKPGVFAINYNRFGYDAYNETRAGLAFGKKFGDRIAAGVQFDYLRKEVGENYGNRSLFTFDVGLRSKITDKVILGVHAFNPVSVKLEKAFGERIPAIYRFGISWHFSDEIMVTAETEKSGHYKLLVRGGIEYKPAEKAAVRIGYSTIPSVTGADGFAIASLYSFGFGLNLNKLTIDLAASVHQVLGWSPTVSLVYNFKKEK